MPRKDSLESFLDNLNERYIPEGAVRRVVSRGSDVEPVERIQCCTPQLTYLLGGGWGRGRLHEFFGPEGGGKTSLMNYALKDVHRHFNGEKLVAVIDLEHGGWDVDWAGLHGVPLDDVIHVTPMNVEQATDIMTDLIKSQRICAVGFDSIGSAQIARDTEVSVEEKGQKVAGAASLMSYHVKKVAPLANIFGVTCFYTNQLRDDMSGRRFKSPYVTPGGRTIKFQMSLRLYIKPGERKEEKYARSANGQEIMVGYPMVFKVIKSRFGTKNREAWSDFYWQPSDEHFDGVGFDVEKDLQSLGLAFGLIEQKASMYSYGGVKARGRLPFFKKLSEEGLLEVLEKDLMEKMTDTGLRIDWSGIEHPKGRGPDLDDYEEDQ